MEPFAHRHKASHGSGARLEVDAISGRTFGTSVTAAIESIVRMPDGSGSYSLHRRQHRKELCPILGAAWERRAAVRRGQKQSPCPARPL